MIYDKFVLFAGITCAWSFSLGMLVSVRMVLGEGLEGLTALSMVAVVMFNSGVGVLITVIFQKFIGAAIEVKLENDLTV